MDTRGLEDSDLQVDDEKIFGDTMLKMSQKNVERIKVVWIVKPDIRFVDVVVCTQ